MNSPFTLEEFFEACHDLGDPSCLVAGTHLEFNRILFSSIYDYDLAELDGIKHSFLSQIDHTGIWPVLDKPMLIISYPYARSIIQIKAEKRILEFINKQVKGKNIILLHSLDHPLMVNSPLVYPDEMLDVMLEDKKQENLWRRFIIPKNPWAETRPAEISLRMIGQKEEWKEILFKVIATCLFPPHKHSGVERLKNFKDNVFLVKVRMKDDSLSSRYEVIKIDSMWKTQNEKANFDVVNTNLTGGKLYHVLNTVNLPGEFVGAVRSCAESSSDLKMFNVLSLRDLFSNNTEPGVLQKVIQQLAKCLDAIYGLGHLNHSEPAFHVYRKRILPEVMEILTPWGLPQIQPVEPDQEISKLTPDFRAIGMPEHEEYCLRLLEIAPDVDNINRCALLFESEDYYGKTFHSNCIYNSHGWRESFIKQGLSQGQKVKVSGIIQRGYFFQIFEEIINLNIIAGLSPASRREKDERVQEINKINAEQKEKQKMEAFIIQTHLSFSTGSPPILKHVWNPLYLLDRFSTENDLLLKEVTGPAHGDLNLDNILIYLEDENNQRRVEHSNDEPEVRLIDLASFATDYPLSFDYVKLEVEIKNHILARPGFLNLGDDFSNWEDRGKFVDFVFQFEKKIWESNEQNDWQERTDEWTEDIKLYLKIIKEIRMLGQARYQSNVVDTSLLYQQQLFFYSLRTMTYRKISKWGKLWAFLAAIVAADHLDLA